MEGRPQCSPSAESQDMHVRRNPPGVGMREEKGTQASTHLLVLAQADFCHSVKQGADNEAY